MYHTPIMVKCDPVNLVNADLSTLQMDLTGTFPIITIQQSTSIRIMRASWVM